MIDEEVNEVLTLQDALKKAQAVDLDLVEVAPNADPPVVKIVDFKKLLFEEKKKAQKSKTGFKSKPMKEFRFGPNIGQGDLRGRINRARGFLEKGHHVKFTIQFKGRENRHPEVGKAKIQQAVTALTEAAEICKNFERRGRFLSLTLMPKKK